MYNYELTDLYCIKILKTIYQLPHTGDGFRIIYNEENMYFLIKNNSYDLLDKKAYVILNYIFNNCNHFITNKTNAIKLTKKILENELNIKSVKQDRYFNSARTLINYEFCIINKTENNSTIIIQCPFIEKVNKLQNGIEIVMGKWFDFYLKSLKEHKINSKFKKGNIDFSGFLKLKTSHPECLRLPKLIVWLARTNENKSFSNRQYDINKYLPSLININNKTRIVDMINLINQSLLPLKIQIEIDITMSLTELKNGKFRIKYFES